jgi:hypothetical protein
MVLDEDSVTFQVGNLRVEGERTLAGSVGPSYYRQGGCRFSIPASMLFWLSSNEEVKRCMMMMMMMIL